MLPTPHNEPAAPEVPRRRFRKLRIAWSVGWGVVVVLLCVLWVRSYAQLEVIFKVDSNLQLTAFGTSKGSIYLMRVDQPYSHSQSWYYFHVRKPYFFSSNRRFDWARPFGGFAVQLPTGVLVLTSSILAGVPWLSFRFSLRTLLIATMLVALVLGLIVYIVRKPPELPPLDVGDFGDVMRPSTQR